jgi:16S rRNA (guanine527-N7)-methyltransferase
VTAAPSSLVPREAVPLLESYVELLIHWNKKINLIASREISDFWRRHIIDCAQLLPLAPAAATTWIDLGSGAGLPGLVCATIAESTGRRIAFTLVDADGRKAAFLREASRALRLDVDIVQCRIEDVSIPPQDMISARALAPLERLVGFAAPLCHHGSALLFPKGRQADLELTRARRAWHIRAVRVPSLTDPEATILKLSEVSRRR